MKKSSQQRDADSVSGGSRGTVAAPQAGSGEKEQAGKAQVEFFEEATRLFHSGDFQAAREKFQLATEGPNREMAHAASLHVRMCEQRLSRVLPELNTPDDHYNYGIALMNRRELAEAEKHLRIALEALPDADHVHYALALCYALQGDLQSSYDHLKRAIEIEPRNRSLARSDTDFQERCKQSPLRELVYPEKAAS